MNEEFANKRIPNKRIWDPPNSTNLMFLSFDKTRNESQRTNAQNATEFVILLLFIFTNINNQFRLLTFTHRQAVKLFLYWPCLFITHHE